MAGFWGEERKGRGKGRKGKESKVKRDERRTGRRGGREEEGNVIF